MTLTGIKLVSLISMYIDQISVYNTILRLIFKYVLKMNLRKKKKQFSSLSVPNVSIG